MVHLGPFVVSDTALPILSAGSLTDVEEQKPSEQERHDCRERSERCNELCREEGDEVGGRAEFVGED